MKEMKLDTFIELFCLDEEQKIHSAYGSTVPLRHILEQLRGDIDNSIPVKIITGSEATSFENGTEGCFLCKFGDKFGRCESEFCKQCKLKNHQYYE